MFADLIAEPSFVAALAVVIVAGMVRGFAGFGSAMVMAPVLSLIYGPAAALAVMAAMDLPAAAQLGPQAIRNTNWRLALPMAGAAAVMIPFGAWVLVVVDPETIRIAMSVIILALVAVLSLGRKAARKPSVRMDMGVGAISGLMGGATGLGGPPVILYLLSGNDKAPEVRANVIGFFLVTNLVSLATLTLYGLMTWQTLALGLVLAPAYMGGLFAGTRLFRLASEKTFRRFALVLLATVGGTSLAG